MSRSLVGSSSSSTLGSSMSSRVSCSRRRSPPDRSPTRVCWRGPVNPSRCASWDAVSSLLPSRTTERTSSTASMTRRSAPRLELAHLLRQHGQAHGHADLALAGGERHVAGQRAQQRRLAGAVDPDDAGALAGGQPPGDVVEQHPVAELDAGVDQVDDVLAEPGGREAHQLDVVAGRRLVGDEGVRGVDAELGLAGARRRPAAQPGELLAQQVVAALGGDPRHPLALGLGQHEGRVAALVGVHRPRVDLPGLGGDGVEEPPVVGDGDDGVVGPWRAAARGGRPARRPPRRRGGWSARRAAAGRARRRAGRPARPGGARRRRAGRPRPTSHPPPGASVPPSRPVSTSRMRASAAQTCSGRSPMTVSCTVAAGSIPSSWVSTPMVRPPTRATRPESTSREPSSTRSRVVLPPPLRPDDADAVAAADAERDGIEHLGGAEREGGALDGDEVGH